MAGLQLDALGGFDTLRRISGSATRPIRTAQLQFLTLIIQKLFSCNLSTDLKMIKNQKQTLKNKSLLTAIIYQHIMKGNLESKYNNIICCKYILKVYKIKYQGQALSNNASEFRTSQWILANELWKMVTIAKMLQFTEYLPQLSKSALTHLNPSMTINELPFDNMGSQKKRQNLSDAGFEQFVFGSEQTMERNSTYDKLAQIMAEDEMRFNIRIAKREMEMETQRITVKSKNQEDQNNQRGNKSQRTMIIGERFQSQHGGTKVEIEQKAEDADVRHIAKHRESKLLGSSFQIICLN